MRCHIGCITLPCLAVLLSLGGCIFDSTNAKEGASASTTTTAVSPPTQNAFVRTCKTSVHGTIDSADWRNHSIFAGPLVFYYADQFADQPESLFAPIPGKDGYYAGQKLLILVQRGPLPRSSSLTQRGRMRRSSSTRPPGTTSTPTESRTGKAL